MELVESESALAQESNTSGNHTQVGHQLLWVLPPGILPDYQGEKLRNILSGPWKGRERVTIIKYNDWSLHNTVDYLWENTI